MFHERIFDSIKKSDSRMTKIFFKEKPTADQISQYEEGLKHLLQYQRAEVKVVFHDRPVEITTHINGVHMDNTYHWIDHFLVKTPGIEFKTSNPFRDGIDDSTLSKDHIWSDAFLIQDKIYHKLNKTTHLTKDNDDPYWKLWDLRED
ncbi:hypothetical protein A2333_02530 [Candidatus Wolfebacteria bacterium RIFOXYB2_FULL_49_7]|uniref:Uncharacterized protein n=1 Tax=Candidatus Wolfebacteria bacterium RIFOXYB1_FULL_54_12 TaxID=1802559 RepID=A0A1F8DWQ7_9BACT|nr:MAG: hypothetical protein A2372_00030 [Candidatus Wolfebacteria bacterium RIFOXYB1_FULL_54_12]OGM96569.1 MAG: hypothetical protein A2333_02530 [Candidatus Wolfebacteria bacterium RIFOXYB2_FULL_49_7]